MAIAIVLVPLGSGLAQDRGQIQKRQADLLSERYDLSDRPAQGVTMSRGKPVQEGVRVKLLEGTTWQALAAMSPEEIREKNLLPKGFYPLPHPNHPEGGMVFPKFQIEEIKKQEGRDLTRVDLDYDLPDHFLPEFPAPIYLTTRTDLGDVSRGTLVTIQNYYALFNGILNPKQLRGSGCCSPPSHSSSSTRPRIAAQKSRVAAWPALIATRTAIRMRPPTWSATSDLRSSAIVSIRRRSVA
jgi:hypothetical protein